MTPTNTGYIYGNPSPVAEALGDITIGPYYKAIGGLGYGFGEKIDQLVLNTAALEGAGFRIPDRLLLGRAWCDEFRERSGADEAAERRNLAEARQLIFQAQSSEWDRKVFDGLCEYYSAPYLMIRPSLIGDMGRGVGVLASVCCRNDGEAIEQAVKEVHASAYTEKVRWLMNSEIGGKRAFYGMIVEPLSGHFVEFRPAGSTRIQGGFAPLLGGYGYTDSPEGLHLHLDRGLGFKAVTDPSRGLTIGPRDFCLTLGELLKRCRTTPSSFADKSLVMTDEGPMEGEILQPTLADYLNKDFGCVKKDMMLLSCKNKGIPYYLELTVEGEYYRFVPYVHQFAEVAWDPTEYDRCPDRGRVLLTGDCVRGAGIVGSNDILICTSVDAEDAAASYGREHPNYILVVGFNIDSNGASELMRNAAVVLDAPGPEGEYHLGSHMVTELRFQQKIVARLSSLDLDAIQSHPEASMREISSGFQAVNFSAGLHTVSSEASNRLEVVCRSSSTYQPESI